MWISFSELRCENVFDKIEFDSERIRMSLKEPTMWYWHQNGSSCKSSKRIGRKYLASSYGHFGFLCKEIQSHRLDDVESEFVVEFQRMQKLSLLLSPRFVKSRCCILLLALTFSIIIDMVATHSLRSKSAPQLFFFNDVTNVEPLKSRAPYHRTLNRLRVLIIERWTAW